MDKSQAKCPFFMLTSNGTGKYYIMCGKDESNKKRTAFKTTDARKAHFARHCMKSDNGCRFFRAETTDMSDAVASEVPAVSADISSDQTLMTTATTFDFSVLDQDTAAFVMAATATIMRIQSATVMAIGRELAPVRERLANRRNGTWQQWCRSIGMSDDTATRYIRAYEWIISNSIDVQIADSIQTGLLFEASKPSAPQELQAQVISGDITTRQEYIKLEDQLKKAREEANENRRWAEANANDLSVERRRMKERTDEIETLKQKLDLATRMSSNTNAEQRKHIADLEAALNKATNELDEARKQPIEMAIQKVEVLSPADEARMMALAEENERLKQKSIREHAEDKAMDEIRLIRSSLMRNMTPIYPLVLETAKSHRDAEDPVRKAIMALLDETDAMMLDLRHKIESV